MVEDLPDQSLKCDSDASSVAIAVEETRNTESHLPYSGKSYGTLQLVDEACWIIFVIDTVPLRGSATGQGSAGRSCGR